jgi:peptidoglycan LD-endopeptidase CwlK
VSAGASLPPFEAAKVTNDLRYLAPKFAVAVERAIAECNAPGRDLQAKVQETYRSSALQALYYERGRTVKPPERTVTNAKSSLYSWHGYGLAVDVIHRTRGWDVGEGWFREIAEIFKQHECKWGGDWTSADLPHFQWARCKASPSALARELMRTHGVESVWKAVGAMD